MRDPDRARERGVGELAFSMSPPSAHSTALAARFAAA
jgi:hypothetical protein